MSGRPSPVPGSLLDLLHPDAIHLCAPVYTWQAAVAESGRLLQQSGATTAEYAPLMLQAVERFGPYIVVAPGVALPHARPGPAVLRPGISWMTPSVPIRFGHPTNDPVDLVIGLASPDHDVHVDALHQVAMLVQHASVRAGLAAAEDPDQLLHAIDSCLGKKDT